MKQQDAVETKVQAVEIADHIKRWHTDQWSVPEATVVIPVNAMGDLEKVLNIVGDVASYTGKHALEIILVVNNFPPDQPPEMIQEYEAMGLKVVAIPNVRKPGEAVGFTARIPGIRAAASETVILFDADCRIPNATALIDWYVKQFQAGADVAYTKVGYYELREKLMIQVRMWIHYTSRWVKRTILGIPTTRGSNYAVKRSKMLSYYDESWLADEMNVGPTFKRMGGKIVYSGAKPYMVLTSGRMFSGKSWRKMFGYFIYRLRYNLRVLPVGKDVKKRTGREKDPIRKYENNRPV